MHLKLCTVKEHARFTPAFRSPCPLLSVPHSGAVEKLVSSVMDDGVEAYILVCLIFFCSWKMPYIRASEVGGHPGT